MKRRGFLAALAAVPFLRRWAKPAQPDQWLDLGGNVFMFSIGSAVQIHPTCELLGYVTRIDYKAGRIWFRLSEPARE